MASVLEGLMSSRRRGSRSRSESEKRLHSRWGDATITAPNAGWSQQHPEAQLNHPAGQAHGSPDSQKTLVNQSPDLTYDPDKAATVEPTTHSPPSMVQRERSAIVITIPLPWSRKTQRRSLSVGHLQARDAQPVEHVAPQIDKRLDDRPAEADSWPLVDPLRSSAPGAHPEKGPGPGRLPQLQTGVPPARSQPASAISVLSPVAESFNGLSESNNATPMGTTPIAEAATDGVPPANRVEGITARNLTSRLDIYLSQSPNSLPSSLIANPVELSESDFETSNTQIRLESEIKDVASPEAELVQEAGLRPVKPLFALSRSDPHDEELFRVIV
ncbi:hypothetical protein A1O3_07553 [Capronia epimyces CBS 606.96]|uniref:Uncharacterized protein n=1 Tax=Capronia epimyces CBS 606.96 TaxID=1182542 RepID=W9XM08_9EURO|nr:uncharacterized protein A1O3_07553 [Capronia epimyces CBS 606.96]EXJ81263.1 hypothetical protein A1O3_07553 [Capronia epimyces CBS 606.96]